MLLCDRIINDGIAFDAHVQTPEMAAWTSALPRAISQSMVVQIDNVAEYLYERDSREFLHIFEDFPNLAPPSDRVWMEFRFPRRSISKELGEVRMPSEFERAAIYLQYSERRSGDGWNCVCVPILSTRQEVLVQNPSFLFWVDKDGVPHSHRSDGQLVMAVYGWPEPFPEELQPMFSRIPPYAFPALLAISFMHCRNVAVEDQSPPPKLAKAYQRRHGRPMFRFKTLQIEPIKRVLRTEGKQEENGLKRALHICRGHFAHYTERGLFGKQFGSFWIPQHLRGSADAGSVSKTYEVMAPA